MLYFLMLYHTVNNDKPLVVNCGAITQEKLQTLVDTMVFIPGLELHFGLLH